MESKSRSPEEQKLIDAKIAAIKKKEALIKKRQLEIEEDKRLAEAQDAVVNLKPNIEDWLPDKTPPLRPSNRVSFGEVEEMNPTPKENPFRGRGRGKREDKQIYQKVGGPPPDPVSFLADPDRDLPAEPPNSHYQNRNRQDAPPKNYNENWRGEEKWSPPKATKNESDWRGERQKNVDRNWRGDASGDTNSDERNASIKSSFMQQDWRKAEAVAVTRGKNTHHVSSPNENHSVRDDRDVRSDVLAKNSISHGQSFPERETTDLRQRLISKRHDIKGHEHPSAASQEDSWNSRESCNTSLTKQSAQIPPDPIQKTAFNMPPNQTGHEIQSSQNVYESNFQQSQNAAYYSNSKPQSNYEAQRVIREIHQAYQLESDDDWEGNVECVTNQQRIAHNRETRTAQLNAAAWAEYNDCENDPNPVKNYDDLRKPQIINRSVHPQNFIKPESQFWNETVNTRMSQSTDAEPRNSHPDQHHWNELKSTIPLSNLGQNPLHYEQVNENQQARLAYPLKQPSPVCQSVLESRNPHSDPQHWNEPKSRTLLSNPTHYEQVQENQQVRLAYPSKQPSSACPSNYDSRQIPHGQHPMAPGSSHQKFVDPEDPTHYNSNNPQIPHHTPTQAQMEELRRQVAFMYQSSAGDQRIMTSERSNAMPVNPFQGSDSHSGSRQSQVHAVESKNWNQPQDDLRSASLQNQSKGSSINERLKRSQELAFRASQEQALRASQEQALRANQEQVLRATQHAFSARNPTTGEVAQFVYSQTEGLRQIGKDFQADLSAGAIQKGAEIARQIERHSRTQNYPGEVEARQSAFSAAQRSHPTTCFNSATNQPNYATSNTCIPTADGFSNFETFDPNDYDEYSGNLPENRNLPRNIDRQHLSSSQNVTPHIGTSPQVPGGPMTQFNTQRSGSNQISQPPSNVHNVTEYSRHDCVPPNFATDMLEGRNVYNDRGSNQSMIPHNVTDAQIRGQMIQSFPQQSGSKRLSQPPATNQSVSEFSPSNFVVDNFDCRNIYGGDQRSNQSVSSHSRADAQVPGQMTQFSIQQSGPNRIPQHPPTVHGDNDHSQFDNDPSNYPDDDPEVRNVYYVDEMYSSENLTLEPPPPAPMKLNMLNDRLKRAQISALQRGTEVPQQHVQHHGAVSAPVNSQRPIGRAIKGCRSESSSNSPDSKSAELTHFDNWQDCTSKINQQGPDLKNPSLAEPTPQISPPRSSSAQSHASSNPQSDDAALPLEITLPTCIDLSKPPPKLFASPAVSPTPEKIPEEIQANIYSAPPPPIPELNPDSADIENLIAKPYHQYKPPSNQDFRPKLTFSLEKKGLERADNQSQLADDFQLNQVDQSTRKEDGFSQNARGSTKNSKAFQTNKEVNVEKRISAAERVAKLLETPPVLPDYTPSYVLKVLGEEEIRNIKSRTANGRSSQDVGSQ